MSQPTELSHSSMFLRFTCPHPGRIGRAQKVGQAPCQIIKGYNGTPPTFVYLRMTLSSMMA